MASEQKRWGWRAALALLWMAICVPLAAQGPIQNDGTEPQVLVTDTATSTTWTATRFQLQTDAATLREAVRGDDVAEMQAAIDQLAEDLELFGKVADAVAPVIDAKAMRSTLGRAGKLLENLKENRLNGSTQELVVTTRLLDEALVQLEGEATNADLRNRGVKNPLRAGLPADWGPLRYDDPAMRSMVTLMPAKELIVEIARRRSWLRDENRSKTMSEVDAAAREIGELARALAMRQGEFPDMMRPGFRNTALQLEVIAENLVDYSRDKDRYRFRQQTQSLGTALERAELFLKMRDEK